MADGIFSLGRQPVCTTDKDRYRRPGGKISIGGEGKKDPGAAERKQHAETIPPEGSLPPVHLPDGNGHRWHSGCRARGRVSQPPPHLLTEGTPDAAGARATATREAAGS